MTGDSPIARVVNSAITHPLSEEFWLGADFRPRSLCTNPPREPPRTPKNSTTNERPENVMSRVITVQHILVSEFNTAAVFTLRLSEADALTPVTVSWSLSGLTADSGSEIGRAHV